MAIVPGLAGTADMIVTEMDTADAVGSGDVPVLATPRLVALMESATVNALRGQLPTTHTSVGSVIDIQHLRPTPTFARVHAEAKVVDVHGVRIVFEVTASHEDTDAHRVEGIGKGRITRVMVERERFLQA